MDALPVGKRPRKVYDCRLAWRESHDPATCPHCVLRRRKRQDAVIALVVAGFGVLSLVAWGLAEVGR